jgi:hypothetical protein
MLAGLQQMRRSHPDFQVNTDGLKLTNFFLTKNNKVYAENKQKPAINPNTIINKTILKKYLKNIYSSEETVPLSSLSLRTPI